MHSLKNCIGPTIRIGREILCLLYVRFSKNRPLGWFFLVVAMSGRLSVCVFVPFPCNFFQRLSLALRSHDKIPASHWSPLFRGQLGRMSGNPTSGRKSYHLMVGFPTTGLKSYHWLDILLLVWGPTGWKSYYRLEILPFLNTGNPMICHVQTVFTAMNSEL